VRGIRGIEGPAGSIAISMLPGVSSSGVKRHDRLLFNNSGWKVKVVLAHAGARGGIACSAGARANWVMYCIVFFAERSAGMHKLKRESYLLLCDALGDFALGCFLALKAEAARL